MIPETVLIELGALAAAPYVIAGALLLTGKWRISTAPAPKAAIAEPPAAEVSPSPSGDVPASVSASTL